MAEQVLSDQDPRQNIVSLNKHRMRAKYWRQMSNEDWVQTDYLPADPESQAIYFSKGFRAINPDAPKGEVEQSGEIRCPFCQMKADSPISLKAHLNEHISAEADLKPPEGEEDALRTQENEEEKL